MFINPLEFIRKQITLLKQLANEHEEYLPEDDRVARYKIDVSVLEEEVDEVQLAQFDSHLSTEIPVLSELSFHSRKMFEALQLDSIEVNNIGLEESEIKLLKILELVVEADSISKSIDNLREDNLDELPASLNKQVAEVNKKFILNIDLIFSDVSDKELVLDSIKEMDNEMTFFCLHGFYESQALKFLKGMPLVI